MTSKTKSFRDVYQQSITEGLWQADEHQSQLVDDLDALATQLTAEPKRGWQRFLRPKQQVHGLYIWGSVGRGKTALVNSWCRWLEEHRGFTGTSRMHFQHLVAAINDLLQRFSGEQDPLHKVADALVERGNLLVIDEFYVEDIASAMILARTLKYIFAADATLVITTNTPPDKLYEGGLHHSRFVPAIAAIKANCRTLCMGGDEDMRKQAAETLSCYVGIDPTGEKLELLWNRHHNEAPAPTTLPVHGRQLSVLAKSQRYIWFTFAELFCSARNAHDYIWLCSQFDGIFVSDMQSLTQPGDYNAARRVIAFIDEAYESKTTLIASSNCRLWEIFAPAKLEPAELDDPASTASVLIRDFERTHSRLYEMNSWSIA